MDLTDSIAPRSDQMNADDLMTGPRTFTIAEVRRGTPDQPVDVVLAEFPAGRPFKPSKSMRRVMVAAWGKDSAAYIGQRVTLYRDPEVTFGRDKVGGIRISHMTGIDKRLSVALTVTRGKRAPFVVEPLTEAPQTPEQRVAALRAEWKSADTARREVIEAEVAALTNPNPSGAELDPDVPPSASVEPSAPEVDVEDGDES